jgi:hypothetical protein
VSTSFCLCGHLIVVLSPFHYRHHNHRCRRRHIDLVKFVFDLYDSDGEGFISKEEIECLLQDVYGKNFHSSAQARIIMGKVPPNKLSFNQFVQFTMQYSGLLFPAFTFQSSLRQNFCGEWFWKKHTKRRKQIAESNIEYAMSYLSSTKRGKRIPGLFKTYVPRRRASQPVPEVDKEITSGQSASLSVGQWVSNPIEKLVYRAFS